MAQKSGRVGVLPSEVTPEGKVKGDSSVRQQIGSFYFREYEGQAQYKTSAEGEWQNFSQGGGLELIWENPSPNTEFIQQYLAISSEYDLYIFKCARTRDVGESDIRYCGVVAKNSVFNNKSIMGMTVGSATYQRNINIDMNGSCFISSGSPGNGYLIPLEIYGLKGV